MENKIKLSEVLKKYTMVIVLAVVVILFTVNTGGKMLLPQNVNNLIAQNAYVFILATGMLFCILTGGNIDLSVGSVVCFVGAIGGSMMINMGINPYLTLLAMAMISMAGILDRLCEDPSLYCYPGRDAYVPRIVQCGASGNDIIPHTGSVLNPV